MKWWYAGGEKHYSDNQYSPVVSCRGVQWMFANIPWIDSSGRLRRWWYYFLEDFAYYTWKIQGSEYKFYRLIFRSQSSTMDYIRNSKNRKLKTQILNFFTRVSFSGRRLDIAGRAILFCNMLLFISVFFPWIRLKMLDRTEQSYTAFSLYSWGIGFGIILWCIGIWFFLFSHEKKERIRAYVPFRLSDTQAMVFISSLILVACIEIIFVSMNYTQIAANGVNLGFGFDLGLTAVLLILFAAFFYSQSEKISGITLSHLDKKDGEHFGEYRDILDGNHHSRHNRDREKNMTLPF